MLRALPVGHVVSVGDRFSAGAADEVDNFTCRAGRRTRAVQFGADVVDDDLGSLPGELQRVTPAYSPARTGDDHHASLTDHADSLPVVARSRSSYLTTLPLALSGRASMISMRRGTLKLAMR